MGDLLQNLPIDPVPSATADQDLKIVSDIFVSETQLGLQAEAKTIAIAIVAFLIAAVSKPLLVRAMPQLEKSSFLILVQAILGGLLFYGIYNGQKLLK